MLKLHTSHQTSNTERQTNFMTLFIYARLSPDDRTYLLNGLVGASHTPVFRVDLPEAEQAIALQQADIVLGNPPPDWFTDSMRFRWWQLDSAGFERYSHLTVPVNSVVWNVGDYYAWPCAETMMAGILGLYRDIPPLAVLQSRGEWVGGPRRRKLRLLRDQSVIILGAGAIAQFLRQMLLGFGCHVSLMARTNPEAQIHTIDDLKTALPNADIVISTLPGSAAGFFTADLIAAMKPGSVFANVGRGNTVDESALIEALQRQHLWGAVLDVTETEPLPAENPLWTLSNVILTQHTGGGLPNEDRGKLTRFLDHYPRFVAAELLPNRIELARGY
jgi:glyoxylate/hydroxypyruvate reductase